LRIVLLFGLAAAYADRADSRCLTYESVRLPRASRVVAEVGGLSIEEDS
jgi:hypothetical protein